MEGILPEKVQWRRDKKGYALPIEQWLLLEDSNFSELRSLLLSPNSASQMYLEPKAVERLLTTRRRDRCQGPAYGGELIWRCLTLELWMRQFLQSKSLG